MNPEQESDSAILNQMLMRLQREGRLQDGEYRELYDRIGASLAARHSADEKGNPCSLPVVTDVVLRMADFIPACPLLNVGMGGYPLIDLELARRGFRITGVEYSFPLAQLSKRAVEREGTQHVSCLVADGIRLPFKDQSFDAGLCSETVEHVPDDHAVIREIHRVLKPGGLVIFTVPCKWSLHGIPANYQAYKKTGRWISHSSHLREYTYQSAKRLVGDWFDIEKWFAVPFTQASWQQMPYESFLSALVHLPGLKHFSLSIALLLRKKS